MSWNVKYLVESFDLKNVIKAIAFFYCIYFLFVNCERIHLSEKNDQLVVDGIDPGKILSF